MQRKQIFIKTIFVSLVSSIIFVMVLLIGLKVGATLLQVSSGTTLSASSWNELLSSLFWNDGGSGKIYFTGTSVGIGLNNPSEKLEVNGNVLGTPIYGRWRASNENNNTTTPDYYIWGHEISNNYSSYFSRSTDKKSIVFNKAGVYLVVANLVQRTLSSRCDVSMYLNSNLLSKSLSPDGNNTYYKHHFSEIIYFNAGDQLSFYSHSTSNCKLYSSSDVRDTMAIYRLN